MDLQAYTQLYNELERTLASKLQDRFTAAQLLAHFQAWEGARKDMYGIDNMSGEDGKEHVAAFLRTLPPRFESALRTVWMSLQDSQCTYAWVHLSLLIKRSTVYMQHGVPSPAEVAAFDGASPTAMNGKKRLKATGVRTCKFCASMHHAVERCPEITYVRRLENLGYIGQHGSVPSPARVVGASNSRRSSRPIQSPPQLAQSSSSASTTTVDPFDSFSEVFEYLKELDKKNPLPDSSYWQ